MNDDKHRESHLDGIVEKGFDTLLNDKRQMKNARPRHPPPR